jgi:hypothetical protein
MTFSSAGIAFSCSMVAVGLADRWEGRRVRDTNPEDSAFNGNRDQEGRQQFIPSSCKSDSSTPANKDLAGAGGSFEERLLIGQGNARLASL